MVRGEESDALVLPREATWVTTWVAERPTWGTRGFRPGSRGRGELVGGWGREDSEVLDEKVGGGRIGPESPEETLFFGSGARPYELTTSKRKVYYLIQLELHLLTYILKRFLSYVSTTRGSWRRVTRKIYPLLSNEEEQDLWSGTGVEGLKKPTRIRESGGLR